MKYGLSRYLGGIGACAFAGEACSAAEIASAQKPISALRPLLPLFRFCIMSRHPEIRRPLEITTPAAPRALVLKSHSGDQNAFVEPSNKWKSNMRNCCRPPGL